MDAPFIAATLLKRGVLNPGPPHRVLTQLATLRKWGFGLAGEVRQAAARSPGRVALLDEARGEVTYGELLARSERLAAALRATYRLRSGDRVGLLCRNHATMVEFILAAGALGVDCVLMNTGLSGPQLATIAAEQSLKALLHDTEFAAMATEMPADIPLIDESTVEELVAAGVTGALRPPSRDGRVVVLTSGTTGAPKGARRPTPPGFLALASMIDRIPLRAGERMLISAPLFHSWGYAALQLAFGLRGTAVLQRRFEPTAALATVERNGCGAVFAVPVMLQRILEAEIRPALPKLRIVAVSGSALPGGLATRFMDAFGDVLYNLYGTTEVSWASVATPADLRKDPQTAGRALHGTRVLILDDLGVELPRDHVGRIFVANGMLFDGYTSGATKESQNGALSTGDVGHLDRHGLLHVDGREDDMIVSGGENVFPGEVENLLAALPEIREVAVVGVVDEQYGQRLAAFVVLSGGVRLDAETVREHVRLNLARFCVPRDVFFIEALPRNATGKVLARSLTPPA